MSGEERTARHPMFLIGVAQKALEDIQLASTLDEAKAMARQARHAIDRPSRGISDTAITRGRASLGPVATEQLLFQGVVAANQQPRRS